MATTFLIGVKNQNNQYIYAADIINTQPRFCTVPFAKHFQSGVEACEWWEENKLKFEKYIEHKTEYSWNELSVVKYVISIEPVISLN